jgi:sensor c-di-GMP phosphodiesterase-like protein
VEYGQGFLHASPMDAAHLARWLARSASSENALTRSSDTQPSSRT